MSTVHTNIVKEKKKKNTLWLSLPSRAWLLSGLPLCQTLELFDQILAQVEESQTQKHLFSQKIGLLRDTPELCAPQFLSQLLSRVNLGDPAALLVQSLLPQPHSRRQAIYLQLSHPCELSWDHIVRANITNPLQLPRQFFSLYPNPDLVLLQWRKEYHHSYMFMLEIKDQRESACIVNCLDCHMTRTTWQEKLIFDFFFLQVFTTSS